MKSKNILSKKVVIPAMALSLVAIVYLGSVNKAQAWSFSDGETLVNKIATKFGLKEAEVEAVASEFRYQRAKYRHENMEVRLKARLDDRVSEGVITAQQELALIQKHEELNDKYDDLYSLSPEDRREVRADMREELDAWAEKNGISMSEVHQFSEQNRGNHSGRMGGMGYRK